MGANGPSSYKKRLYTNVFIELDLWVIYLKLGIEVKGTPTIFVSTFCGWPINTPLTDTHKNVANCKIFMQYLLSIRSFRKVHRRSCSINIFLKFRFCKVFSVLRLLWKTRHWHCSTLSLLDIGLHCFSSEN